jgi:hypothetical protein
MRNLTTTLCLTIVVLLGSMGVSWSADFQKGLTAAQSGDFATALFLQLKKNALSKAIGKTITQIVTEKSPMRCLPMWMNGRGTL